MKNRDNLDIKKYPKKFQEALNSEIELLKEKIKGKSYVLDVGCGNGRAIPDIAPLVDNYYGIDIDENYLNEARKRAMNFPNVNLVLGDIKKAYNIFEKNKFDYVFLLFNTLCCINDPEKVLNEIFKISKGNVFFSLVKKGSLDLRLDYYKKINIEVKYDENETTYSKAWGEVKAYNIDDIKKLVSSTKFKIKDILDFSDYIYIVILKK